MKTRLLLSVFFSIVFIFKTQAQVNFSSAGLSGVSINNPTSLDFGPDGRLYVSVQSGEIYAYTIQRQSSSSYQVTATETILAIKQIQNHNDDGALHNVVKRQITGILADGTATHPILYVSSSDYGIGGGGGGSDKNLDSNSGLLSKLIWNGSQWERIDLVRGLPRSEENHATNGMQLDSINNILYLAVGGNTNAGSPSNNFAFLNEYALSAAIVSIDLNDLDARPVLTDAQGAKYVYDLPTLDDPTRSNANGIDDPNQVGYDGIDINDPFGGNDGLNQAKWVLNGPVQVYASGFRNAYDIVLTADGRMYTWDNGANQGWGGHPHNEGVGTATNNWVIGEPGSTGPGPNDAKVNNKDGLHFISGAGYYGGHPNPIRANPNGAGLFTHDHANGSGGTNGVWRTSVTSDLATTLPVDWPPVDPALAHPIEGDFQNAGVDDQSLYTITASTNGMAEYRATNFNGNMQGDLLAASFNGNIYRVSLNAQGSINSSSDVSVLATGFGAVPLDITAQADDEVFPGTIWAATYGSNAITIFEPRDFSNCNGNYDNSIDEDNDGYTNADEIDNQTNPCSGASFPNDNDQSLINGFKVSDLNDPDDDDDGILDTQDAFALDANNGTGLQVAFDYPLLNGDPGFGLYGLGFTGFMTNGSDDYLDLYYTEDNSDVEIIAGGAVGLLSFNDVPEGSPFANDLKNGFQFGMAVDNNTLPFQLEAALVGPLMQSNPQGDQFHAFYVGTGDQDNYLMFGANANQGNLVLSIWIEENGNLVQNDFPVTGLATASEISLFLEFNPLNQSLQAKADLGNGLQNIGNPINFPNFLANIFSSNSAMALGVAAGKASGDPVFNATYDFITATYVPNSLSGDWSYLHDGSSCTWNGNSGSCPQGRHEASYVEAGNHFVLIGGREHDGNVNLFDPQTGIWTKGATPPMELHHYQAVEHEGLIYALLGMTGKFPNEVPVEHIYIYDPEADAWHQGPEIPANRRRGSAGAVVYQDKIYLVGGIQNGHTSGWVPWLDVFDPHTNTWTALNDAPRSRDHFHATVANGKLYAAGGRKSGFSGYFGGTVPEVDVYDFSSATWSTMNANIPAPKAGASVAVIGDELILIGGESSASKASNLSQALSLSSGTWRNLDTLNTGRHGTQAIVNNLTIYLPSGSDVQGGGQLLSQEVFSFGAAQSPILNAIQKGSLAAPSKIDFGTIAANQSVSTTVYLKNSAGNQGLYIDSIAATNKSLGLSFSSNHALPIHIAVGDSLALSINYNGSLNLSDSLIIWSSALNAKLSIPVEAEVLTADAIRINCGGPDYLCQNGDLFEADAYFLNGGTYSKQIGISNTNDPELYQTERWDANLAYSIPVDANGNYQVNLHFAEIYSPNFLAGARLMEINLEGQLVNLSLDIFDTVGGYSALVLSYTTEVRDGSIDLSLVGLAENAKLSAIEISPLGAGLQFNPSSHHFQATALGSRDSIEIDLVNNSNVLISIDSVQILGAHKSDFNYQLASGTAIPSAYTQKVMVFFEPSASSPVVRSAQLQVFHSGNSLPAILNLSGEAACPIAGLACDDGDANTQNDTTDGNCNCQGSPIAAPAYSLYLNVGGAAYTANDGREFIADQYFLNGSTSGGAQSIANTSDDELYTSERWAADLAYAIPLPEAGLYRVKLHFAEIWNGAFADGKRVFSMWLEDSMVIEDLDIYATAGAQTAYIVSTTLSVDDTLDISSLASVNNVKLSAIGIEKINALNPLQGPFLRSTALSFSGSTDSSSVFVVNPDSISYSLDSIRFNGANANLFSSAIPAGINAQDSSRAWFYFNSAGLSPGSYLANATLYFDQQASPLQLNLGATISCPVAGSSCDDGDSTTINDLEDGNCNCAGTPISNPSFSLNINCGGGAHTSASNGKVYLADQYNIGGYTYTYSKAVANATDSAIYSTARIGRNMSYAIPLPSAGSYSVTLHFAEVQKWLMYPNKRVFDISAEGQLQLNDLDIVALTGSGASAHSETFTVYVNDGELNINTAASSDNSILMAIEISSFVPSPATLSISEDQFTLSAIIGNSDSADFYLINNDNQTRAIDSVKLRGGGAAWLQSSLQAGISLNPGDSLLAQLQFTAPGQAFSSAQAEIVYYLQGDSLQQEILMNANCRPFGSTCDDGDSTTINDIEDGNCNCSGSPVNPPQTGFSLNINCGGPNLVSPISGKTYIADQYNIGGYTYSYSKGVQNTSDSALYSTARIGRNMSYVIPLPEAAEYEVTLHFAELQKWLMGPQRRVFDISAEGQLVLDDIDIFTLSGAGATAYSTSFRVTVNDGELDLNTAASVDNSLLVAIEISTAQDENLVGGLELSPANMQFSSPINQQLTKTFRLVNTDTVDRAIDSILITGVSGMYLQSSVQPGDVILAGDTLLASLTFNAPNFAINNESVSFFYLSGTDTLEHQISLSTQCPIAGTSCDDGDSTTINDVEDGNCNCAGSPVNNAFSININCGGSAYVSPFSGIAFIADQYNIGGYTYTYSKGIANTNDSILYSTCRIGRNMSYDIPVPQADLYEVTLHFAEVQKWLMGPQRRVFDISAEGQLVLDDIDIYSLSEAGATAYSETFTVQVNDGELDLNTAASSDNSLLVAIEVKQVNAQAKNAGTENLAAALDIQMYPNPLSLGQSLDLELPKAEPSEIQIFTLTGLLVHRQKLEAQKLHSLADLPLSAGMYLVRIIQSGESHEEKMLVR